MPKCKPLTISIFWLICIFLVPSAAISQQQRIPLTGVVKSKSGEPVIGATIRIKNTALGTATDVNGLFKLSVPENSTLEVSYIGYLTQLVQVGKKSTLEIVMQEDAKSLDEVVVVGYSATSKRTLASAISSVKAQEITELPVTNMTQGLAGRSPGLIVQGSGGGINKTSNISIRGAGQPLVVIDGIIREYNDFVNLAPEDVESFTILKDASATAVYGARAGNGILQVTTKQGRIGKPRLEYSFNQSWSQPNIWPRKLNSYDMVSYRVLAAKNDGIATPYSDEQLQKFRDGSDPQNFPNTDWQRLTLNDFAPQTKHNLSLSGGNEAHSYYISLGNIYQNSLYKNNNNYMKRTNFLISETAKIQSIGLKGTAQIDGYTQMTTHPNTSNSDKYDAVFSHIQNKSPTELGVNKFGLPYDIGDNPIAETAKDAGYNRDRENIVNGLVNLEWSVPKVPGLVLKATGNYRFYQKDNKKWRKDAATYTWDSRQPRYRGLPQLSQKLETGMSTTLQYFMMYSKTFAKHSISALGGYESTYAYGRMMELSRDTYDFAIDQVNPGPVATAKNGGEEFESGRAGWIGQVEYNYDRRYILKGNIRYDGSDNFPVNRRWGLFYSGAAAWIVSDEPFMASLRDSHIFDMLKLRASYGVVGLDNWPDDPYKLKRFAYIKMNTLNGTSYVVNKALVPGFKEGELPSPDITWFTTTQIDVGFDFSSLKNRLYGYASYFYTATTGFLYAPDPLVVGYTDPLGTKLPKVKTNGELRRAGFEFQLGWRDNIGEFSYDISTNFTRFDQLWANNPDEKLEVKKNPYQRGVQEVGYHSKMYQSLGFYENENDVYNAPKRLNSENLTAGDIKYYDFNGDGVVDDADKIRRGKSKIPRGNYGVNISMSYKGFTFSTLLQGATRFDMLLGTTLRMDSGSRTTPLYGFQTDFWTPSNRDAKFPRLLSATGVNGNNNKEESDFWLVNGAYLRMKDFRFSYDFKRLVKVPWLSKLVVGVSGQNIFTISEATKYGLDPENGSTERYDYPNERVFAINLNLGF